jgi:hypothetical protein
MIQEDDISYLETVETRSFAPVGWLYEGVYERLLRRGLVARTVSGGYILSDDGAEQLKKWRVEHSL